MSAGLDIGPCSPWNFLGGNGAGDAELEFLVGPNNRALILYIGGWSDSDGLSVWEFTVNGDAFVGGTSQAGGARVIIQPGFDIWVGAESGDTIGFKITSETGGGQNWSATCAGVLYGAYAN